VADENEGTLMLKIFSIVNLRQDREG